MRPRSLPAVLACLAACGQSKPPPTIDADHLPAELRGLVPGVATEADLDAAFRGATAVRDLRFGGNRRVQLSGEPAIQVQVEARGIEAWLIWLDGEPRIASMFARLRRSCGRVAEELGDRVRPGSCHDRVVADNEHPYCAATPDRHFLIDISCFDPPGEGKKGWISTYVFFAPAQDRWYSIGPEVQRPD